MKPNEREIAEGILFTDQYQLTMAQVYFRAGLHERHVQFDHFFRSYPNYGTHQAGYCVNAGLEWLLDWMERGTVPGRRISSTCAAQRSGGGRRVFDEAFLAWLRDNGNFDGLTLRAIPEGRVVHPQCAADGGRGADGDGADTGDVAAEPSQLPDVDRDKGRADTRHCTRRGWSWSSDCGGRRRRAATRARAPL